MRPAVAAAPGVNDDPLVVPLLHGPEFNLALARRLQCWQFSVILHSLTAIICIWKDNHTTPPRYIGPGILLVTSIMQLGLLLWRYPLIEDVFTIGMNICLGCWFYLLVAFTDVVYFKDSHISITLEILLIFFTVCMHAVRFVTQDLFEFNWLRLTIAVVGCIPAVPTLFQLHELFSKPDTMLLFAKDDTVLINIIVRGHIIFKISTIIGALFRLLDVIFVCIPATRETANYFLGKLQECFN